MSEATAAEPVLVDKTPLSEDRATETSKPPSTDLDVPNQKMETAAPAAAGAPGIAGTKLFLLLGSLTLASFLIFLDSSIVSTVSIFHRSEQEEHEEIAPY